MSKPLPRILIADDDREMRELITLSIQAMDVGETVTVHDGIEALEALRREPFSLIVCDWFMPRMKGIDLLRIMRADKRWKKTPFLMVTAEATAEDVEEAVLAGCDDYLIKPFSYRHLEERVRKLLG